MAMGNGLIEAAANPLVATIYPDRKTEKLNIFHVWFPGGIVIGGLLAFGVELIVSAIAAQPQEGWLNRHSTWQTD